MSDYTTNSATTLLNPNLERHPDKTAYICSGESVTFRELTDAAHRVASLLRRHGIAPGDRVMLMLPDSPVFVASLLGSMLAGAVAVLAGTALTAKEYRFICDDSGSRFLFAADTLPAADGIHDTIPSVRCGESLQTFAARLPVTIDPATERTADDNVLMLYTSGSTGNPKGVPHSGSDLLATAEAFGGRVLAMTDRDCIFSASKLFFAYGLGNSFTFPLRYGATTILFPGKPEPTDIHRIIAHHGITLFFGVPVVYNMLIKTMPAMFYAPALRLCVSAGEALPAAMLREWQRITGIDLIDGIGSTEALHIYIANRPGQTVAGASGYLIPPYEARIVDENGCPAQSGSPGLMHIRGPSLALGYWNRPDKTAATMLAEGWLNTGDIYIEHDGCFFYQGRHDDMFKVDAQWVSPIRVEEALRQHPAVFECGVSWRTIESLVRPMAFVVLNDGHTADSRLERDLRRFVATRLPPHMAPVQILFVTELPKTATGKIQHFRLRAEAEERSTP